MDDGSNTQATSSAIEAKPGSRRDHPEKVMEIPLVGANRPLVFLPCVLTADDLRKLATMMEGYAKDAAEREVGQYELLEGQTIEQLESVKAQTREYLRLSVQVVGDTGEWLAGRPADVLKDEALPDVITQITFDTSFAYRVRMPDRTPIHGIILTLNFRRRSMFDFSNSASAADENLSTAVVHGADRAWVSGVYEHLRKFFAERRSRWSFLHHRNTYDVLLMFLGWPLLFLWLDRTNAWLAASFTPLVRVGVLIYIALLGLYTFRVMFNLACRVFPRTKGPRSGTGGGFAEATFFVLLIVGWVSTLFLDNLLVWFSGPTP